MDHLGTERLTLAYIEQHALPSLQTFYGLAWFEQTQHWTLRSLLFGVVQTKLIGFVP